MSSTMTKEERRQLTNARQSAVRNAWKEERARVENGLGTRDWTPDQQKELLETGRVSGYDGHHMKSVSQFPQYAGDPNNIQFLSEDEHFEGAHQGSYHNATNGYYDPKTCKMNEFDGDELKAPPVEKLSERYDPSKDNSLNDSGQKASSPTYMEGVETSGGKSNSSGQSRESSNSQSSSQGY